MKKLLILFVALFSIVGTMPTIAARQNIKDLPLFEIAIILIKHYESLPKRCHWPTIGYGHVVQRGEPYYQGIQLNEAQAEILLRKRPAKVVTFYDHLPKYKLLLGVLAYNIGPRAVNKSSVYKKLLRGYTNIYNEYTSYCHYKGKWDRQLNERRRLEYQFLFTP